MDIPPWRWIVDTAADGPTNMARDEALLKLVGEGKSPPTLRFYRWSPPTISLGYFQKYADYASLAAPAGELAVVRRLTGGGAILHDLELTYSLILPINHPLLDSEGPHALYDRVHSAVAEILVDHQVPVTYGPAGSNQINGSSQRGPFFCFQRHSSFDLMVDGRKLMGSAQRRTRSAVLQHGSLILDSRYDQQQCASLAEYTKLDIDTALSQLARTIGGQPVGKPQGLTSKELDRTDQLRAKYASPEWNRKR